MDDGDSFDSFGILPPPPPKVSGFKVKVLQASQDYHQTFLLAQERMSARKCNHSVYYHIVLVRCGVLQ